MNILKIFLVNYFRKIYYYYQFPSTKVMMLHFIELKEKDF